MSSSTLYHRLTRRGKVLRVVKEHYLRDDIPCGLADCAKCPPPPPAPVVIAGPGGAGPSSSSSSAAVPLPSALSPTPANSTVLVLDTNTVLHQMDFLEAASSLVCDVVVLETVLEETKHRSLPTYGRLRALVRDHPDRRFVPFANAHHRDTHSPRRVGETPNDYNDRLIRDACAWLRDHFRDRGLGVLLLTHDAGNAKLAAAMRVETSTVADFVAKAGPAHAKLLELLASPAPLAGSLAMDTEDGDDVAGAGAGAGKAVSALEAAAAEVGKGKRGAAASSASASSSSSSSRPASSPLGFREHLTTTQMADAVRSGAGFQGTVRVNRDCWFEARVMIHGLRGRGAGDAWGSGVVAHAGGASASATASAAASGGTGGGVGSGGDDSVSVLIIGREAMNRATEGDTVVIELLPQAQWKQPSTRIALPPLQGEDVAASEREAIGTAPASAAGPPSTALSQRALASAASTSASTGAVPTGRVVGIIKRAWRSLCGSLEPEEPLPGTAVDGSLAPQPALFVPVDSRYPRVRIETRQKWSLMDKRLVVALDAWDSSSAFPRGHYVRTIGKIGDKTAENEVILLEHDIISRPFSADVLACLPPADFAITPENSAGRTDLRHLDICSIDPPGCRDIDDALHARPAEGYTDGSVEVGVHIADVTYFVRHGTAIDVEAAERANTTYLVERRIDMLPKLLTETLCSLKGGVDRFAFSVTWRFRPVYRDPSLPASAVPPQYAKLAPADRWELVPGSSTFFKSIIHSRAAMTYAQAQALLDDPAAATPVAKGVKLLASIARSLRHGRVDAGALSLASAEVKFLLDSETHEPLDVMAYEMRETNNTVEEFMLLGNVAVAERVWQAYPRCSLLRRHPVPPKSAFNSLLSAARVAGVELNVETSKALATSLDNAQVAGNPYVNRLLRILATRCMLQAAYFPSGEMTPPEFHHYGLAAPIYTHFTSPIRRYADVVVHRLLAAALAVDPLPEEYQDKLVMRAQCDNMNKRHLMSQLAGRASGSLHTNIFFHKRIVVERGLVMRLRANGIVVLIPRFGIEGAIVLGRAKDDVRPPKPGAPAQRTVVYDEEAQTLSDATTPEALRIRIFQEVRIALVVETKARHRKELVYKVVDPPFDPFPAVGEGVTVEGWPHEGSGKEDAAAAVGSKRKAAGEPPAAAADAADGAKGRKGGPKRA
jgi:exosome complex exonuclease DIS3/RRP44